MSIAINRLTWISATLMLFTAQGRLTPRQLSDIGTVEVPSSLKRDAKASVREEYESRLTFEFASTYFWASFGSSTAYKQLLIVSIMAPDATDTEYAQLPRALNLSYEHRTKGRTAPLGTGVLTITEGVYERGSLSEPAVEYVYVDKQRRLQIAWHAVKKEIDVARSTSVLAAMASSFRITRDPRSTFAAMRAAPVNEAAERAHKLALAKAMLVREGYPSLVAEQPVLRNGVYLEWMDDPEPRYQLLLPLGRVRRPADASLVGRPRPVSRAVGDATDQQIARGIGWREHLDGDWTFSNDQHAYLPMAGIRAHLASQQQDPAYVYFYYAASVRIEEEDDDARLTSLRWFFDQLPDVQRRWRAGTLITPGTPERN
jgi:hypothetical protein